MNKKRNNKGFSLVELIVVVAIMAVLVGVLAPAYLRYVEKSRVQKDVSAVAEVVEAIKVAAANESVADEITSTATVTVTIPAGGGALADVTGDLKTELDATIGNVKISSDTLKGGAITITAWKDATTKNLVINVESASDASALDSLDVGGTDPTFTAP